MSTCYSSIRTLLGIAIAAHVASASAANVSYDVGPGDLATGKPTFSQPHGLGSNAFAYDWDSAAPEVAPGAPAGFGDNSFYADVSQTGATQADRYRTLRIGTRDLAGIPGSMLELGELVSVEYQTKKPTDQTQIDWRLSVYTTPGDKALDPLDAVTGPGDRASWYRNRIQSLPYNALGLNAPADQWNTWSTGAGANQLQFYTNRPGFTVEDIDWSELTAGNVNRGVNNWDFSGEEVMMLDITMGANTGGGTGLSQLDAVVLTFSNGNSVTVNTVPEPASVALVGVAVTGSSFFVMHRRRRRAELRL
jgi:hypothetical protein